MVLELPQGDMLRFSSASAPLMSDKFDFLLIFPNPQSKVLRQKKTPKTGG
jgi:hypothetical protein